MLNIFKYPLEVASEQIVLLPTGARPLSIDWQESASQFCLWAVVDPKQPPAPRRVRLVTTGESVSFDELRELEFMATAQAKGGAFVAHFFIDPPGR